MLVMDLEVKQTLDDIVELGFVSLRDGRIIEATPPKYNLCHFRWDRWSPTLKYIADYTSCHSDMDGDFFVCLYDGWREYSAPAWTPEFVPWSDAKLHKAHYLGVGRAGEPRFRHAADAPVIVYPELPLPILTYNKHVNDRNAICIPDAEFIESQYKPLITQVGMYDIPWNQKKCVAMWRGSVNTTGGHEYAYLHTNGMHPRQYLTSIMGSGSVRVDASFAHMPIANMLHNKYLFDLDGMVSAWSGLYWKLLSQSVVLKHKSHWTQWYYPNLKPWTHYVPIDDFRNLDDVLLWCKNNDAQCQEIAKNATAFAQSLTYKYAVEEFTVSASVTHSA